MKKTSVIQPGKRHANCGRKIRNRKLTASDFAIDLHQVLMEVQVNCPTTAIPSSSFPLPMRRTT
jgi:hypothetical protein